MIYLCRSGLKREGKLIIACAGDPKESASADATPERNSDNFKAYKTLSNLLNNLEKRRLTTSN